MYGLAQEYWLPKILFAITSSVGTPICNDVIAAKPMFDRTFGHYARVLVDMDSSQTLRHKVLVERIGYAFFVELDYENLTPFSSHCKVVGHYLESCKWLNGFDEEIQNKEQRNNVRQKNDATVKYVIKKDGRAWQNKTSEVIYVENSSEKLIQNQPEIEVPNEPDAISSKQTPEPEVPNEPDTTSSKQAPVINVDVPNNAVNDVIVVSATHNRFAGLGSQVDDDVGNEKGADLENQVVVEDADSRSQDT
jgi:hypothetical protein